MARIAVTADDLIAALVTASTAPHDARTVVELAGDSGLSERQIRTALRHLQSTGRLGVHRVVRRRLDGQPCLVPAYTIAK